MPPDAAPRGTSHSGDPGKHPTSGIGPAPDGPARRTVLKAFGLPVLTPGLAPAFASWLAAGCARPRGTLRVAVQWSGWELAAFQQVLAQFTSVNGWDVEVVSIGSDIGALLGARVARASAPDVAMLSQPGQVRQYQDRLVPVDPEWVAPFPRAWRDLLTIDGRELGIWFKTAHKSMVWYRPDLLDTDPPRTYQPGWLAANRTLSDAGSPPLAIGAADGWVLSDWFSNVLLALDPPTYRRLAIAGHDPVEDWHSDVVSEALTQLGMAWAPPGTFPGGVRRALLTQFQESVVEVFTRAQAAMNVEGDFVYPVIARYAESDVSPAWFPFPPPEGHRRRVLVGGDAAVLLDTAGPGGRELMAYLAGAEAANIWARQGGFVSVRDGVPAQEYPSVYTDTDVAPRALIDDVRLGTDGAIDFSLSDQLTGALGGTDGGGLWRVLQDFLAQVGSGGGRDVPGAVARAVDSIVALAR